MKYENNATVTVPLRAGAGYGFEQVLLLLLCMAASEVRGVQARPIDFVCDDQTRRDMNNVKELEAAMGECSGSSILPATIHLPCVRIHKATWDKKSLQEKKGQIQMTLKTLGEGLQRARAQAPPGCQVSLLERIEHSVTNYLHIVTHLEISGKEEGLDLTCHTQNTQDLGQVLLQYGRLLRGKLEWFVLELRDRCQGDS
ncbi:hypothetical protein MATL_G00119780 [Megalops atlanticus]|uniref:Thrombopoietin n=1 Tax=Megalops atlanticus TaxID=7932 RepID=A0A9D3PYF7_MEGAT|nr:hypothetical protein MATL_G00119780 [Megalops atlanticus]